MGCEAPSLLQDQSFLIHPPRDNIDSQVLLSPVGNATRFNAWLLGRRIHL